FLLFNHPSTPDIYTLSLHDALPISYRGVGRTAESTAVHAGIHKSPRVWTRSGQSFGDDLALQRTATLCDTVTVEQLRAITQISSDRKSTRLNSSHVKISYAVFCLKK